MRILWLSAVSSLICAHTVLKIQYRSLIQSENFDNVHTSWVKLSNFSISKLYAGNPDAEWARCAIKNSKYNCHNSCARNVIKIYSTFTNIKISFAWLRSYHEQHASKNSQHHRHNIYSNSSKLASHERENTQPSLSFNYRFNLLITAENGTQHDMKVTS